jgi:LysM repeat protein
MPLTEGEHAFFVRATGTNDQSADSNVVHIHADVASGFLAAMTTQGGETLQDLAEQNGITVEQIAADNPSLDPHSPIPSGTQILLPIQLIPPLPGGTNPTPPSIIEPAGKAKEGSSGNFFFWSTHTLTLSSILPEAPGVSVSMGVCNVTLHSP